MAGKINSSSTVSLILCFVKTDQLKKVLIQWISWWFLVCTLDRVECMCYISHVERDWSHLFLRRGSPVGYLPALTKRFSHWQRRECHIDTIRCVFGIKILFYNSLPLKRRVHSGSKAPYFLCFRLFWISNSSCFMWWTGRKPVDSRNTKAGDYWYSFHSSVI